jgi:tetratricopeptide (TPR) repeat protein
MAVALAAICVAGWSRGHAGYKHWRSGKLAAQARVFLEKKDITSAVLTAQRGLRVDFDSPDCWEVLARAAETYGKAEAIYCWMKVVDQRKDSLQDVTRCAEAAVRFGNPSAAADALQKLSGDHHADPQYQALRGKVARANGQWNEAVEGYAAALKLEPQNEDFRLAYASVLLSRGWIEDRPGARQTLEGLRANPKYRVAAARVLLENSLANREIAPAVPLARELAAGPQAGFTEKLTLLDLLRRAGAGDFRATLAAMEDAARGKPAEATQLLIWMQESNRFDDAIDWSNTFSQEDWADPRVCAAVGVNFLGTKDWPKLEKFSGHGNWAGVDFLRCALLARALREQHREFEAQGPWMAAVTSAGKSRNGSAELAKFIAEWGWDTELISLLRPLLKDPKEGDWAARTLLPLVSSAKSTPGLWEATARLAENPAASDAVQNNFAMFSLLLGKDVAHAYDVAKKLYPQHPVEGDYVSTYAFALHRMGHTDQGLVALAALGPEKLCTPDYALYYGVLLAARQDWVQAPKYLQIARHARVLPEEEKLIFAAERQVAEARIGPSPE